MKRLEIIDFEIKTNEYTVDAELQQMFLVFLGKNKTANINLVMTVNEEKENNAKNVRD